MTHVVNLNWELECAAREIDAGDQNGFLNKNVGIYLWVYRNKAASRVIYVGKSVQSPFKKRLAEHFRNLYGSGYSVQHIDEEVDWLDFFAIEMCGKSHAELNSHEKVCWYTPLEDPHYFRATFFENIEKRTRILSHYLDHLSFAFATIPSSAAFARDAKRVEAAIGRGLYDLYLREIKLRHNLDAGRCKLPGWNTSDTFVGRHAVKAVEGSLEIRHQGPAVPKEIRLITRYPLADS